MFNNAEFLKEERKVFDGVNIRFLFPNGYGASVLRHSGTYGGRQGLWEIAVLHENEPIYDTPITSDLIGWLDDSEVEETLEKIKKLPPR